MPDKLGRAEIFALASKKLRQDFEELQAVSHSGVKGAEAEDLIKRFLNQHLPLRFKAVSGFIIDHKDEVSSHNDVIIYDAFNCPLYRASEDAAIIPNDNVAAVIEVKSRLDKARLENAGEKIAEAKLLAKRKPPRSTDSYDQPINYETLGLVFAYDSPLRLETLTSHYADVVQAHEFPTHIDYVFVLDKAMLSLASDPQKKREWSPMVLYQLPPVEGLHIAVGTVELGEGVLDAFVAMLLTHLRYFRQSIDQPAFNWSSEKTGKPAMVQYVTSVTHETDPAKRARLLAIYREEARAMIGGESE